jgi:flagellar basal body rod protein FlgB
MDLFDSTQNLLEGAMRGAAARQSALATNLANANTPG